MPEQPDVEDGERNSVDDWVFVEKVFGRFIRNAGESVEDVLWIAQDPLRVHLHNVAVREEVKLSWYIDVVLRKLTKAIAGLQLVVMDIDVEVFGHFSMSAVEINLLACEDELCARAESFLECPTPTIPRRWVNHEIQIWHSIGQC